MKKKTNVAEEGEMVQSSVGNISIWLKKGRPIGRNDFEVETAERGFY